MREREKRLEREVRRWQQRGGTERVGRWEWDSVCVRMCVCVCDEVEETKRPIFSACELTQLGQCLCTPTQDDLITRGSSAGSNNRNVYNDWITIRCCYQIWLLNITVVKVKLQDCCACLCMYPCYRGRLNNSFLQYEKGSATAVSWRRSEPVDLFHVDKPEMMLGRWQVDSKLCHRRPQWNPNAAGI